jgi:hypothetical protein
MLRTHILRERNILQGGACFQQSVQNTIVIPFDLPDMIIRDPAFISSPFVHAAGALYLGMLSIVK